MHSYIGIYQFTPQAEYKPIEALIPFIEQTMSDQNVVAVVGEDGILEFKENIVKCMQIYYRLVGITDEVIAGKGSVDPKGILPRFTESLISYFQKLQQYLPENKEIKVLEYSGAVTIKVRYKYTDSVIKKLIKLGLQDSQIFAAPLQIFLKGGALHDLVGMLFVCATPHEKEWVARALYNFFEYDWRTDDHLTYGFYSVERKSGYRGLHCDHTLFNPRFDAAFSEEREVLPFDSSKIFSLLNNEDTPVEVLHKLKVYFNVEIQLHTTFENLWSSMEHSNSYNVQAKGKGRNSEITAQWKMLADNMRNLELQFERLQIDTEQARFKEPYREGYAFIKNVFEKYGTDENNVYDLYKDLINNVEEWEKLFSAREISRQDYVEKMQSEAKRVDLLSKKKYDPSIQVLFKLAAAFINYGLANHNTFFNEYDIRQFVQRSLKYYEEIYKFISAHDNVYKGDMIKVVIILRYLQMAQKYGYGLIKLKDVTFTDSTRPVVSYEESLTLFEIGISLLNNLSEDDLDLLRSDNAAYIKVIHKFDILAQEWELFNHEDTPVKRDTVAGEINKFRKKFMQASLMDQFTTLLETDKVKDIGFVVNFYSLLLLHGHCQPLAALKNIVKYSAYDKIRTSDIFYYELAVYKISLQKACEKEGDCSEEKKRKIDKSEMIRHTIHYHKNNMIQQLFRIYRDEPIYDFHKARLHFEKVTHTRFKISHFSDCMTQMKV